MELKELEEKYIYTFKIIFSDGENFVELREPNVMEMKDFGTDDKQNFELMKKLFPKCLIDHSFTKDGEKANVDDVVKIIEKSAMLYQEVITKWVSQLPLAKRLQAK